MSRILSLLPGESSVFLAALPEPNLFDAALADGITHLVVMPRDEMWPRPWFPGHFEYFLVPGSECGGWSWEWFREYAQDAAQWAARRVALGGRVAFVDSSGGGAGARLLAQAFLVLARGWDADGAAAALEPRRRGVPHRGPAVPREFGVWLRDIGGCPPALLAEREEADWIAGRVAAPLRMARHKLRPLDRSGPLEAAAARFELLRGTVARAELVRVGPS
jgi:hypothetical protein